MGLHRNAVFANRLISILFAEHHTALCKSFCKVSIMPVSNSEKFGSPCGWGTKSSWWICRLLNLSCLTTFISVSHVLAVGSAQLPHWSPDLDRFDYSTLDMSWWWWLAGPSSPGLEPQILLVPMIWKSDGEDEKSVSKNSAKRSMTVLSAGDHGCSYVSLIKWLTFYLGCVYEGAVMPVALRSLSL